MENEVVFDLFLYASFDFYDSTQAGQIELAYDFCDPFDFYDFLHHANFLRMPYGSHFNIQAIMAQR